MCVFVYVCACVCLFVYTLSPAGFFRLQDVCDIPEMFWSTALNWRENDMIWCAPRKDDIYWCRIWADLEPRPTSDEKILKDTKGGYSNLNSSTLNQVLGIGIKKICLSLLNVAASLRRALLDDGLGWILLVR